MLLWHARWRMHVQNLKYMQSQFTEQEDSLIN